MQENKAAMHALRRQASEEFAEMRRASAGGSVCDEIIIIGSCLWHCSAWRLYVILMSWICVWCLVVS